MEMVNLISDLGYPISTVIACGYYIYQTQKQSREDNLAREEKMSNQISDFSKVMEKFNVTLQSIDKRLEDLEDKVN